jgi:hypothetical protein
MTARVGGTLFKTTLSCQPAPPSGLSSYKLPVCKYTEGVTTPGPTQHIRVCDKLDVAEKLVCNEDHLHLMKGMQPSSVYWWPCSRACMRLQGMLVGGAR